MKKIEIHYNESESMMSINISDDRPGASDTTLFYGNYWDFRNNPEGIAQFLTKLGHDVKLQNDLPCTEEEQKSDPW